MDSDEELDFVLGNKAKPMRGRRRNAMSSQSDDIGSPDDFLDSPTYTTSSHLPSGLKSPLTSPDGSLPTAPPRSRRTGGWADEAIKSGKKRNASSNQIEQERFRSPDKFDNFDDDIPVIPDLDEMAAAEASAEIAFAPSVAVNRVATYQELDSDLFKHAAFATLDDVNLQLLTKCLNLEGDLKEEDECWTWDLLFTNVSSKLHTEWEAEASEKEPQQLEGSQTRKSTNKIKPQGVLDEDGGYFDYSH